MNGQGARARRGPPFFLWNRAGVCVSMSSSIVQEVDHQDRCRCASDRSLCRACPGRRVGGIPGPQRRGLGRALRARSFRRGLRGRAEFRSRLHRWRLRLLTQRLPGGPGSEDHLREGALPGAEEGSRRFRGLGPRPAPPSRTNGRWTRFSGSWPRPSPASDRGQKGAEAMQAKGIITLLAISAFLFPAAPA